MSASKAKKSRKAIFTKLREFKDRIPKLFNDWYRQLEQPLQIYSDHVVFLNDMRIERQVDGTVRLYLPDDLGKPTLFEDVQIRNLDNWLRSASKRIASALVNAERKRIFGHLKLKPENAQWLQFQAALNSESILGGNDTRQEWIQRATEAFTGLLDAEAWRLARLVTGESATLAAYNRIVVDLGTWRLLERQSPGLLPLVDLACKKACMAFNANAFRSLKQYLMQQGLRESGWKTLCQMPIGHTRWLADNVSFQQCAQVANHYAEAGVIPELELLQGSCQPYGFAQLMFTSLLPSPQPLGMAPAWFDAAASRELARQKQESSPMVRYFMDNEYQIALDWLRDYTDHGGTPDTHQKSAGWNWIKRQSDAWHEAQVRQRTTNHVSWTSAIEGYTDNGVEVVPLLNSADLEMEGLKMHHCVGAYALQCYQGYSRIFSIRKDGMRLATAELVNNGRSWSLNQNRGPCNSLPGEEIMAVAQRLQDRYNAASQEK